MKILIVDRVKLFQKIIASVLSQTEIGYEFSDTGQEALSRVKNETYDMICISMYMDDIDGIELTQKIRKIKQYNHTPIILITSEESDDIIQKAMKLGITDVFEKKDIDQLVNFISRFGIQNKRMRGSVLYVEDTLSQRLLVTEILVQHGLKVDGFASGEKAFSAFLKKDYDMVITDIVLDGCMSGVTLANRIRRLNGIKGDVPILAVTAFDDISRRIGLFHLGINDYVIKPIVEEELVARVRALIENRLNILELQEEKNKAIQDSAAKSEFLALTSHELRTPLNAIIGFLQLLKIDSKEEKVSSSLLDSIAEIDTASHYLLNLINEVLDLSKIEAGEMDINTSSFNVCDVVLSSIEIIKHAASTRGIIINKLFSDNIPHVLADSSRLKQVMINLLSNAVKYNSEKGEIFISVRYKSEVNLITISVRDTGKGLSKEAYQGVFEKFNRLGADITDVEGTGLGLYITKKMVNEMQGELTVTSDLGVGTTFLVSLPAAEAS